MLSAGTLTAIGCFVRRKILIFVAGVAFIISGMYYEAQSRAHYFRHLIDQRAPLERKASVFPSSLLLKKTISFLSLICPYS